MLDHIFFAPPLVCGGVEICGEILTAYLFYFPDDPSPQKIKTPSSAKYVIFFNRVCSRFFNSVAVSMSWGPRRRVVVIRRLLVRFRPSELAF